MLGGARWRPRRCTYGGELGENSCDGMDEARYDIAAVEHLARCQGGDGGAAIMAPHIYALPLRPEYPHQGCPCCQVPPRLGVHVCLFLRRSRNLYGQIGGEWEGVTWIDQRVWG